MLAFDIDNYLDQTRTDGKKLFWMLLDPDSENENELREAAEIATMEGADGVLVGSSYLERNNFDASVRAAKEGTNGQIPVLLFPGNHQQLSPHADGLLFLSLLSGRNPQYLIGEQMLAASTIAKMKLKTIPTGYLLIENGRVTSVESVTGTSPLPRKKFDLISAHALAGQYLGMKVIYLEGGSGALKPVPLGAITQTRNTINIPLIVGGGLRTAEDMNNAAQAGADIIVVGNVLEKSRTPGRISEFVDAVKSAEKSTI